MSIKKYTNGSWTPACRKYGTETDTITAFPATIIGDGTPITSYTIKGNMEQNGTPTPSSPIYPSECGDLVTSGEHAGQYKLPLTLGSTTTDIYLGEVQSTRRIKKLVLDGTELWLKSSSGYNAFYFFMSREYPHPKLNGSAIICNIATFTRILDNYTSYPWFCVSDNSFGISTDSTVVGGTTVDEFKSWLAAQYAAGTPVTVWYVLAEPETAVVNEPIRKIGDYVDSVSGTGLATSGTAQEFNINTTLKPSEAGLTYHGWHEHDDTKYST